MYLLKFEVSVSGRQSGSQVKDDSQTTQLDLLRWCDRDHSSRIGLRLKTSECEVIGSVLNISISNVCLKFQADGSILFCWHI